METIGMVRGTARGRLCVYALVRLSVAKQEYYNPKATTYCKSTGRRRSKWIDATQADSTFCLFANPAAAVSVGALVQLQELPQQLAACLGDNSMAHSTFH